MRRGLLLKTALLAAMTTAGAHLVVGYATFALDAHFTAAEAYPAKVRRACRFDYKRLCPLYKVSSAQLRACMEAKASQISSDCINALVESGLVEENDRVSERR